MGLSNYQLVLLDNLIYLSVFKSVFDEKKEKSKEDIKICDVVKEIIEIKKEEIQGCFMSQTEWIGIQNAIAGDDTLKNLVIHEVKDKSDSFRAMTLAGKDENIIIFRGTSSDQEWIDDGQGFLNEIFDMPEYHGMYINGSPEDKHFSFTTKTWCQVRSYTLRLGIF